MKLLPAIAAVLVLLVSSAHARSPAHATEEKQKEVLDQGKKKNLQAILLRVIIPMSGLPTV